MAPPLAVACLSPVIPLAPDAHPERLRLAAGAIYPGDSTKAKHQLGHDPRSLEVGLAETLEHEMKDARHGTRPGVPQRGTLDKPELALV